MPVNHNLVWYCDKVFFFLSANIDKHVKVGRKYTVQVLVVPFEYELINLTL